MSNALSDRLAAARIGSSIAKDGKPSRRRSRLSRILVFALVIVALAGGIAAWLMPETPLQQDARWVGSAAVFASSCLALAVGRVPGLALDRAGVALVGAALMVACGAISLDDAYRAVDLDTLTLLLGMMIVVAHLRLSGFFSLAGGWAMRRAHHPLSLLAAITVLAGLLSAFLMNDTICLMLTPLVVDLVRPMRRNPVPFLLAVAMASNIGSTATITGNPQNMMIASVSHLTYGDFAASLAPVAIIGLVATLSAIAFIYRADLRNDAPFVIQPVAPRTYNALMLRATCGVSALVFLLFVGLSPAKAAMIVGGLLLLTRRLKSERVYAEIDWSLLLMFAGLFVIVAAAENTLLTDAIIPSIARLHFDSVPALSAVVAILSNIVSNVPAVLLLKPFILTLGDQHTAWITVAMASTLAGNFTVIGSIANLIVVRTAAARGVRISFWSHFKVGAPLTLLTLAIGTCWLWL